MGKVLLLQFNFVQLSFSGRLGVDVLA